MTSSIDCVSWSSVVVGAAADTADACDADVVVVVVVAVTVFTTLFVHKYCPLLLFRLLVVITCWSTISLIMGRGDAA